MDSICQSHQNTHGVPALTTKFVRRANNESPSVPLIDFIAQLDYCVLNGKNGKWDIGGGRQKDGQPYQISWKNNALTVEKLTKENADVLGIKEYSLEFQ